MYMCLQHMVYGTLKLHRLHNSTLENIFLFKSMYNFDPIHHYSNLLVHLDK
jgi:hypothetical protein